MFLGGRPVFETGAEREAVGGEHFLDFVQGLAAEVRRLEKLVFRALDQGETVDSVKNLLVAPHCLQNRLLNRIDGEIKAAARGEGGYIGIKINSLTDKVLINKLIDGQVAEGFFKECPITFRDIALAKVVLTERLKSIYHTRISYPHLNK